MNELKRLLVVATFNRWIEFPLVVVMIPVGADGEPRPDLLVKKPRTIANCEDYRKSKWEMRYHY